MYNIYVNIRVRFVCVINWLCWFHSNVPSFFLAMLFQEVSFNEMFSSDDKKLAAFNAIDISCFVLTKT